MWRISAVVAALALSGLACGGDGEESAPNTGSPESPACPEGTPGVTARDVIGTPPDG